jgi:hypothetical protein
MSEATTKQSLAIQLGTVGTIRFTAAPLITLMANIVEAAITELVTSGITLTGVSRNLTLPSPNAALKWLIATKFGDSEAFAFASDHITQVHLETDSSAQPPAGGGSVLKITTTTGAAIEIDALKYGLLGAGTLGYEIVLDLPGSPKLTLDAASSKVSFNIPCQIGFEFVDGNQSKDKVQIGTPVKLKPDFAETLRGLIATVSISDQPDDDDPEGLPYARNFEFPIANRPDMKEILWRVGCSNNEGPALFDYGGHWENDKQLEMRYAVSLADPAAGTTRHACLPRTVFNAKLFDIPLPKLTKLRLQLDKDHFNLDLKFDGFAPTLDIALHVAMYARIVHTADAVETIIPIDRFIKERAQALGVSQGEEVLAFETAITAKAGVFSDSIYDFSKVDGGVIKAIADATDSTVQVFAALSFPAPVGAASAVVASIVSYHELMAGSPSKEGFAPFRDGKFSTISMANGVCSNGVDFKGNVSVIESDKIKVFKEFADAVGKRESGGDYEITNNYGYLGKYQFGMARLMGLTNRVERIDPNSIGDDNKLFRWKTGYNKEMFLSDHNFQDETFKKHVQEYMHWVKNNYQDLLEKEIDLQLPYYSDALKKNISKIKITISGLIGGAHLKGMGGVDNFVRKGIDGMDANGTHISEYIYLFADYYLGEVELP